MTEINFYHLTFSPLERALPKLLERTLEGGKRALVLAASEARVDALNSQLWTYEERGWLPHGSAKDGHAEQQPIWLTDNIENPNGASFLFLTDGSEHPEVAAFERVFELFDGRDDAAVQAARDRWKRYREAGHTLAYWRQDDDGRWEKAN